MDGDRQSVVQKLEDPGPLLIKLKSERMHVQGDTLFTSFHYFILFPSLPGYAPDVLEYVVL